MSTMKTRILDGATPFETFLKKQLQKKMISKISYIISKKSNVAQFGIKLYLIIGHIAQHYTRVLSKITDLTNIDHRFGQRKHHRTDCRQF